MIPRGVDKVKLTVQRVFTSRHDSHIGIPKQWNGGNVGVPNQFRACWTFFICKNSLCSNKFVQLQVTRVIFYFPERERERGTNRRGPWKQSWFSWCPYYRGVSDIQRGTLGESWLNICKLKSDLMLTVMSLVSVRVLITPDNKCFTAVSVRTDGAELKKRKLISKYPSQVEVPIIDTGFSFITSWKLPWKRQCFENGNLEVSTFWPRK